MANIMNRTDAAKRVGKTERTLYNWEERGLLRFVGGFVTETALLNADRAARARIGRPRTISRTAEKTKDPT